MKLVFEWAQWDAFRNCLLWPLMIILIRNTLVALKTKANKLRLKAEFAQEELHGREASFFGYSIITVRLRLLVFIVGYYLINQYMLLTSIAKNYFVTLR